MINLNTTFEEKKLGQPLIDGTYAVKVIEVSDWKPVTKDVMLNVRGEDGKIVKNPDGTIKKEPAKDYTFYTADVVLEVLDENYAGRRIYANLTTHPNAYFITENFVRATKQFGVPLQNLPTTSLNKVLNVEVVMENYTKAKTDPDTGMDLVEIKTKAKVKTFK